jgi:hypothetical protein
MLKAIVIIELAVLEIDIEMKTIIRLRKLRRIEV